MKNKASKEAIEAIVKNIEEVGLKSQVINGDTKSIVAVIGTEHKEKLKSFMTMPGVESVIPISKDYKLTARISRDSKQEDTIVEIGNNKIGGNNFLIIAGPCSLESSDQALSTAKAVKEAGAHIFRGGAFKPRTSPYNFQGLREEGLKILSSAKYYSGLGAITELTDPRHIDLVAEHTDIIQIGARNMQNFELLKEVGKLNIPVLMKRGLSATINELLMAAEYILVNGNNNVILCERGIRTFETSYRNTIDINAIPDLKKKTHLPIVLDPSHGTGRKDLITAVTKAGIAAGVDGIIIEVHPHPDDALSDGHQSLNFQEFQKFISEITPYVKLEGKII